MLHACKKWVALFALIGLYFVMCLGADAQTGANGTITGTVVDPSGAVVPGATVEIRNPVSGFTRTTVTDSSGKFTIPNIPFNPYHLSISQQGFAPYTQDVDVRSVVPIGLNIKLQLATSETTVTVEGEAQDIIENTPTFHTDVDRA